MRGMSVLDVASLRELPVAGWEDGDDFASFVRSSGPRMVRLATLLTGNRHDAEDVVQEAFIALGRRWAKVRPETANAYARTTVTRKALDHLARRRDLPVGDVPERLVDDDGLLHYERDRAFFARLVTVPARQRAVLVLRYHGGLDDHEIARVLQCTTSTVRSQAARGLALLRTTTSEGDR